MKKPNLEHFKTKTSLGGIIDRDAYEIALKAYEAHKAAKAEANRLYRLRRTEREQKAQKEAAALRANRDVDPTREEWLMRGAKAVLAHVATLGYTPTGEVKAALGVPPSGKRKDKPLGVCYHAAASEGAYREIFVHPELTDTRRILGVLVHEIGHAVLKDGVGHRKPFINYCKAVGFDFKKAEFAIDGVEFWKWAARIGDDLGPIPHKALNCNNAQGQKKKQGTRLLLIECPACAIKVRTAKATLAAIYEATGDYKAQCMNPDCAEPIDFEELLNADIDSEGEGE